MESAKSKVAGLTSDSDVLERVESVIGLSSTLFPVEELVWGARKLLEELARVRPLVVLFEDIHWAEATFLEFLEQIVQRHRRRTTSHCWLGSTRAR